jgi:hypothetical protein
MLVPMGLQPVVTEVENPLTVGGLNSIGLQIRTTKATEQSTDHDFGWQSPRRRFDYHCELRIPSHNKRGGN